VLVLAGASGRTLAWGPGHLDDSRAAGRCRQRGRVAHRDTHFRFLRDVARATTSRWTSRPARNSTTACAKHTSPTRRRCACRAIPRWPTLTLVTCYPFDALVSGGPLRYVVVAEAFSRASRSVRAARTQRIARDLRGVHVVGPHAQHARTVQSPSFTAMLLPVR
jgi:sortase A